MTGRPRRVWFSGKTPTEVRRKMQAARSEAKTIGRTPTVADYGTHWLRLVRHRVRPATLSGYSGGIRAATKGLGHIELARLRPVDVETWTGDLLAAGHKSSTVATYRRVLLLAMADAERDGLVPRNVVRLARPPRTSDQPPRALSDDERARLLAAAETDPDGALVTLGLATGLRRGEMLALRWEDVEADRLRVRASMARSAKGGYERAEPKTSRSRRSVGLPKMAREALARQRERTDGPLVFGGMHPNVASRNFRRIADAAGLPDVRLHDLRHTAATLALAAGVPVRDVADSLGHSSPSVTLNVYGHAIPEGPSRVADALDKALGGES